MKFFSFILIFTLCLTGCELNLESSDGPTIQPQLIGNWRTKTDNNALYLEITENNILQYKEIEALSCLVLSTNSSYSADGQTLNSSGDGRKNYTLDENTLSLDSPGKNTVEYTRIEQPFLEVCHSPKLEGVWRLENNRFQYILEVKPHLFTYFFYNPDDSCYSRPFNQTVYAHDGKMQFYGNPDTHTYIADQEQLTVEREYPENTTNYFAHENGLPENICSDETVHKEVSITVELKDFSSNSVNFYPEGGNYLGYLSVEVIFDLDNSQTNSDGDLQFSLYDTLTYEDGNASPTHDLYGAIGHWSAMSFHDSESLTVMIEGNTITLKGNTTDSSSLANISNGTQIRVSARYTYEALNDLVTQYDVYPSNYGYTPALDTNLMQDELNDVNLPDEITTAVVADIHEVTVTISE